MDLFLFIVFIGLALILTTLGLIRPEHSIFVLVGCVFLFLLSLVMISSDVQYKVGYDKVITYDIVNGSSVPVNETVRDVYAPISSSGSLNHLIGYWLAVASVIGFVVVLINLESVRKWRD